MRSMIEALHSGNDTSSGWNGARLSVTSWANFART